MLEELKKNVCEANLELVRQGLVIDTWGNASAISREAGMVIIKPSGVAYEALRPEQMVVVRLADGQVVEGALRPSSDTPTHLVLYRAFPHIGGIVHTHSLYATAWAQARCDIPPFGTTHADYFAGAVPCTRMMRDEEIRVAYEAQTGDVIVERLAGADPLAFPGVLVAGHGPFAWGASVSKAVKNAVVLEHLARLASETLRINPAAESLPAVLLDKHFSRKHGATAYYGQPGEQ